jgi:GNAT superfamily N-acetyltransferase
MGFATPPIELDLPTAATLSADDAWWRLYATAFPPAEREPAAVILRSIGSGGGAALRARSDGRTVGLATIHLLRRPAAVFLVYLAVDATIRGNGVGGILLEAAWEAGRGKLQAAGMTAEGMVWEVDVPPRAPAGDPGCAEERRIRFFQRHGGRLLAEPYFQPPVNGAVPVPMRLMYRPADARSGVPATADLVRAMYFEKYGSANGIRDEVLMELLRGSGFAS